MHMHALCRHIRMHACTGWLMCECWCTVLQEKEPMGTAGPLALANEILNDGTGDPFFVLNRCPFVCASGAVSAAAPAYMNRYRVAAVHIEASWEEGFTQWLECSACMLCCAQRRHLRLPAARDAGLPQEGRRRGHHPGHAGALPLPSPSPVLPRLLTTPRQARSACPWLPCMCPQAACPGGRLTN